MTTMIPINWYDLGLIVIFGLAAWMWLILLSRGFDRLENLPNEAVEKTLLFVVLLFIGIIGGGGGFFAMFVTAWKGWLG